jgi:hypothetical protein
MSTLIATIKLREVATKLAVDAEVFDEIDQTHLSNWKTKWVPVVDATQARLLAQVRAIPVHHRARGKGVA